MDPGLSPRAGGWGFSLATMSLSRPVYSYRKRKEIEPKELPSFTISLILIAYTRQLEILATALHASLKFQSLR